MENNVPFLYEAQINPPLSSPHIMNLLYHNGYVEFKQKIEAVTGRQKLDLSYLMENILSSFDASHVVKVYLWFCLISFKKYREILVYMHHVKRKETFVKFVQYRRKTASIYLMLWYFKSNRNKLKLFQVELTCLKRQNRYK